MPPRIVNILKLLPLSHHDMPISTSRKRLAAPLSLILRAGSLDRLFVFDHLLGATEPAQDVIFNLEIDLQANWGKTQLLLFHSDDSPLHAGLMRPLLDNIMADLYSLHSKQVIFHLCSVEERAGLLYDQLGWGGHPLKVVEGRCGDRVAGLTWVRVLQITDILVYLRTAYLLDELRDRRSAAQGGKEYSSQVFVIRATHQRYKKQAFICLMGLSHPTGLRVLRSVLAGQSTSTLSQFALRCLPLGISVIYNIFGVVNCQQALDRNIEMLAATRLQSQPGYTSQAVSHQLRRPAQAGQQSRLRQRVSAIAQVAKGSQQKAVKQLLDDLQEYLNQCRHKVFEACEAKSRLTLQTQVYFSNVSQRVRKFMQGGRWQNGNLIELKSELKRLADQRGKVLTELQGKFIFRVEEWAKPRGRRPNLGGKSDRVKTHMRPIVSYVRAMCYALWAQFALSNYNHYQSFFAERRLASQFAGLRDFLLLLQRDFATASPSSLSQPRFIKLKRVNLRSQNSPSSGSRDKRSNGQLLKSRNAHRINLSQFLRRPQFFYQSQAAIQQIQGYAKSRESLPSINLSSQASSKRTVKNIQRSHREQRRELPILRFPRVS